MNKEKEKENDSKQSITIPCTIEKNEKKIVCPICGHANPEYTALCKNCSNYL